MEGGSGILKKGGMFPSKNGGGTHFTKTVFWVLHNTPYPE
jgi:hypothetical protein